MVWSVRVRLTGQTSCPAGDGHRRNARVKHTAGRNVAMMMAFCCVERGWLQLSVPSHCNLTGGSGRVGPQMQKAARFRMWVPNTAVTITPTVHH